MFTNSAQQWHLNVNYRREAEANAAKHNFGRSVEQQSETKPVNWDAVAGGVAAVVVALMGAWHLFI